MAKKKFNLKSKHKSKKGGLTDSGRAAYNRATGSNLKRPQPEGGSRKKSYCARSKGQMNDHSIDCSKTPDKRICLARRRWKCNKSLQKSDMPPKVKLAAFLREHLDNKLALKAAEPTITKSDEKSNMSALMKALKGCAYKKSNKLAGGKGDAKDISAFSSKEVEMGLKVEMEHTKDAQVAKEIVADHLSEDPSYYSKLKGSGLADELEKAGRCWEGYEPTPGKKPYSKGSCKKIKKSISAEAIEFGEYQGESLDSHHHNRLGAEYKEMAKQAHKMGDKRKARDYHDKALSHFQMADKMGFQAEEPLEKKISDKLRTLGLGTVAAIGSIVAPSQTSTFANKPPAIERKLVEEPKTTTEPHKIISMIESSGGKNIVHRFLKQQGQRAVSQYGLLPSRVIELYARSSDFRSSPTGKMIGNIVGDSISKHKSGNFYDTAAFVKQTPMIKKQAMFQKINQITAQKEHDDAIFQADRSHSLKNLHSATKDPVELDIMATHSHHWHWPRTKRLYEQGGIGAVINDEKSKEGNYIKKYHKNLPEGSSIKQKIEQFLSLPKKLMKPKKKEPSYGN